MRIRLLEKEYVDGMKAVVIGCGRWGSLIAWYLDRFARDVEVTLCGRDSSANMQRFIQTRKNDMLELPPSITLSTDYSCINDSDVIIVSISTQGLDGLMKELNAYHPENKIFVLCMKGLEIASGRRISQIVEDNISPSNKIAVWLGPGHVQEFYNGIPNCMVIDSKDEAVKGMLVDRFSSNLIRFYYGMDIIGNEVGAAAKNVIGIAAGMLDGLGLSTLKGVLMSRGTREVGRLIKAMGGNEISVYGLCHLGDYEATVFSKFSHNRRYGEAFIKKEPYNDLAEGYYTVRAIMHLKERYKVDMPICDAVYSILYEGADARDTITQLLSRRTTEEFYK